MAKTRCEKKPRPKYRHTLTVQTPDPNATPGDGGIVDLTNDDNWADAGTIKGNFISRGGRESRVFDQVEAEISDIVETPSTGFSRTIHPKMRILDSDSVKYNISAAYDVDRVRRVVRIHLVKVL